MQFCLIFKNSVLYYSQSAPLKIKLTLTLSQLLLLEFNLYLFDIVLIFLVKMVQNFIISSLSEQKEGGKNRKRKYLHTAATDIRACLRGKDEMQKFQHIETGHQGQAYTVTNSGGVVHDFKIFLFTSQKGRGLGHLLVSLLLFTKQLYRLGFKLVSFALFPVLMQTNQVMQECFSCGLSSRC